MGTQQYKSLELWRHSKTNYWNTGTQRSKLLAYSMYRHTKKQTLGIWHTEKQNIGIWAHREKKMEYGQTEKQTFGVWVQRICQVGKIPRKMPPQMSDCWNPWRSSGRGRHPYANLVVTSTPQHAETGQHQQLDQVNCRWHTSGWD